MSYHATKYNGHHHTNHKPHKPIPPSDDRKPRNVSRRIVITSQTAYHLTELALQENLTEGMVVDKLMRTYLASRRLGYNDNY